MKQSDAKAYLWKERVRSVQGKAKFVGVAYLLGTIALAAAAMIVCVFTGTCLTTENGLFPVIEFFNRVKELFTGEGGFGAVFTSAQSIVELLVLLIYAGLLLAVVIYVFCAIFKLNWLFKRKASKLYGFNRNMYAMDDLGECYSGVLGAIVGCNLFIGLISWQSGNGTTDQRFTLFGVLVLGAGVLLHFVLGLVEGTVSVFTVGKKVKEEKRKSGLFVYLVRNVVQLVAVALVLWFFIPQNSLGATLTELLTAFAENRDFCWVIRNLVDLIPFVVELLAWIFVSSMISHAIDSTEFSRENASGKNAKDFAAYAFLAFMCVFALIVFPYVGIGLAEGETAKWNTSLVIVAVICFVAFLFDCICKPKANRETETDEVEDDLDFAKNEDYDLDEEEDEDEEAQDHNRPIYIPVYYPITANGPEIGKSFDAPFVDSLRPAPAPAPAYLKPTPSPETRAAEEAEREKAQQRQTR